MSWVGTAVGGAALVGGIYSANKQSGASKDATRAQAEASAAMLEFEREKFQAWQDTYGDLQENLADYYTNLSPEKYAAMGIDDFNKQYQIATDRLQAQFAQAGIDPTSGIALSLQHSTELAAAESKATIRRDAETAVREDQRQFLQIGLGQNPGASMSAAMAQQSTMAMQNQMQSAANAQAAWGQVGALSGSLINAGVNMYGYRQLANNPAAT